MANEDTVNLRNEIRSEMKKNLVALREEGLPLDEIETKMLSMSEELMRKMLPMVANPVTNDHPTMETNRRENDKMGKMINDEEVSVKGCTELETPILQEVSTLELNTQQWGEIESEDEDNIEIVWEEENPVQGKTLTPTLIENSYDVCEDDSFTIYNDNLDKCDKVSFCSWECDSLQFCDDLGSEDDINSFYSCESEFCEFDDSGEGVDTSREMDSGECVHWEVFKDKFLREGIYNEKGEERHAILKQLRVVPRVYLSIHYAFPFFAFEFKDIPHLRAYLESKVHGTLGKVPKSVCLE